ncbi:MAG: hypothetical protein DWQ42_17940 [Planctomycetota bacterium]|nr:MAG: hypothetical protein DWQ42_17940 [Planctomycetota bacterium]REK44432.1 MAG: hypothetical protein DWQ46_09225 [Planctomycetota bacterium]
MFCSVLDCSSLWFAENQFVCMRKPTEAVLGSSTEEAGGAKLATSRRGGRRSVVAPSWLRRAWLDHASTFILPHLPRCEQPASCFTAIGFPT